MLTFVTDTSCSLSGISIAISKCAGLTYAEVVSAVGNDIDYDKLCRLDMQHFTHLYIEEMICSQI